MSGFPADGAAPVTLQPAESGVVARHSDSAHTWADAAGLGESALSRSIRRSAVAAAAVASERACARALELELLQARDAGACCVGRLAELAVAASGSFASPDVVRAHIGNRDCCGNGGGGVVAGKPGTPMSAFGLSSSLSGGRAHFQRPSPALSRSLPLAELAAPLKVGVRARVYAAPPPARSRPV